MRVKALHIVIAIALVSGLVAYAVASEREDRAGKRAWPVRVSGHVHLTHPGAHRRMRVRVRNRLPHEVRVPWIQPRVRRGSPGCSNRNLVIRRRYLHVPRMRPHRTRVLGIDIRMRKSAPGACRGARWPIRYRAKVRVRGSR
jgi:hypothetical protein